jgi:hypothetical protein
MWIKAEDGSLYSISRICRLWIAAPGDSNFVWAVLAEVDGMKTNQVSLTIPHEDKDRAVEALNRIYNHEHGNLDLSTDNATSNSKTVAGLRSSRLRSDDGGEIRVRTRGNSMTTNNTGAAA